MPSDPVAADLDFDPVALREKYRIEREKRVRPDGANQYVEVAGEFGHMTDDPFAPNVEPREALREDVEVVVVGGGHCGLLAAVRLKQAGIDDIRIIDGAADFGGTWYWNRYPGIRCDVDAYVYMPLLEETGTMPTEKYASGLEIFNNAQTIGNTYGLYDKACFQTHVNEAAWDESDRRWTVQTDRGDTIRARFVIMALGPLNRPKLPGITDLSSFQGHMFHTSRWDYEYTGGDPDTEDPEMENLRDKRVGIIGTGCTGIQCAPRVAKYAKHLAVIQRTPSAIAERNNMPTDPEWANSLMPGWQTRRGENFDAITQGIPVEENLVNDGWTDLSDIAEAVRSGERVDVEGLDRPVRLSEIVDFQKMNDRRERVDSIVEDETTADQLKAWYRLMCKRPSFSDNYLPMFNRPNVSLIDTGGKGVERVTERGVVVDGVEHELDCIILASGYEVGTDYSQRGGINIVGRDGVSLADYWSDHMKTLYGFMSHGFPNCFHMGVFLQNASFANFTAGYTRQADRITSIIKHVYDRDASVIEPSVEAEADWVDVIRAGQSMTMSFQKQCTPGYYNGEGHPESGAGLGSETFAGGSAYFESIVSKWFDEGMPGTTIS